MARGNTIGIDRKTLKSEFSKIMPVTFASHKKSLKTIKYKKKNSNCGDDDYLSL